MFGLKYCDWCEKTLWSKKNIHTIEMKCLDGTMKVIVCESCYETFEEFNEYINDMKERQNGIKE